MSEADTMALHWFGVLAASVSRCVSYSATGRGQPMGNFKIVKDWLEIDGAPAPRFDSPNQGGRQVPTLIILHDTAGRLEPGSTVSWFLRHEAKVSAHFVIERDGRLTQMVACDRQAWHAGRSAWDGRQGCNGFSVGIEIVNPGKLADGGATGVAWFGQAFDKAAFKLEARTTDQHGPGLWMPYTPAQLVTVAALIRALADAYPSIREVVGHYHVAPRRKVDVNPLFPASMLGPIKMPRAVEQAPAEVADAQSRLGALGYPVGTPDGVAGPRTAAAVHAFQAQNDIRPTGRLDEATKAALASPDAKPLPTGAREWVTETDLASTSRTVSEQQGARLDGQVTAALGVATTLLTAMTTLGNTLRDAVDSVGLDVVVIGLGGVAAAYGVRTWRRASRTIGYRVEDAQKGVHAGAIGGQSS